jgi:hypothetical protein
MTNAMSAGVDRRRASRSPAPPGVDHGLERAQHLGLVERARAAGVREAHPPPAAEVDAEPFEHAPGARVLQDDVGDHHGSIERCHVVILHFGRPRRVAPASVRKLGRGMYQGHDFDQDRPRRPLRRSCPP